MKRERQLDGCQSGEGYAGPGQDPKGNRRKATTKYQQTVKQKRTPPPLYYPSTFSVVAIAGMLLGFGREQQIKDERAGLVRGLGATWTV